MKTLFVIILFLGFLGAKYEPVWAGESETKSEKSTEKEPDSVTRAKAAVAKANIEKAIIVFNTEKIEAATDRVADEARANAKADKAIAQLKLDLELAKCKELGRLERAQARLDYVKAHPNERSWGSILTLGMLGN